MRSGEATSELFIVLDGLAASYKLLANGERQITSFRIQGDLCESQTFVSPCLDYSISALSPLLVATVPRRALLLLAEAYPELVGLLWRETALSAAIEREWIVNLGRRPAPERMAHLFCEMQARMQDAGLAAGPRFSFPVTQGGLADALGLSTVHVNRSLQQLRGLGLIEFGSGVAVVEDLEALREFAGFESEYLKIEARPEGVSGRGDLTGKAGTATIKRNGERVAGWFGDPVVILAGVPG